jgi:hypothetical protein
MKPEGDAAAWGALILAGSAWQVILPGDITWTTSSWWRWRRSRLLRQRLSGLHSGAPVGVMRRGWLAGSASQLRKAGLQNVRGYVALPSRRRPVLVADREPALLRYLSESLLTIPPGAGPVTSLLGSLGLWLLRSSVGAAVFRSVLLDRVAIGWLA